VPKIDPDLAELNALYAVVPVGNKIRVMRTLDGKAPEFYNVLDFRTMYMNRVKVVGRDRIRLGSWWLCHPSRRQYNDITFAPAEPRVLPGNVYNTWSGWPLTPRKGDCSLFKKHMRENICAGDAACYDYLLGWMADAVQNPGQPAEVAVALCGRPGTGKGIFAHAFGELFGRHYVYISQSAHLVGKFNKHLAEGVLVFADEAFFAGDVKMKSQMKAQITEPFRNLELKGVDVVPIKNCMHLVMASNEPWVVAAGPDERRYFVLNVDDDHLQDLPYFKAIKDEMANGGREALFYELKNLDLSKFNKREIPQTAALAEQKALGRSGIDAFIEDICMSGIIPCSASDQDPTVAATGAREGMSRNGDKVFSKGLELFLKATYPALAYSTPMQIRTAMVKDWKWSAWHHSTARGLRAPPLPELRALFDEKWGPQNWPSEIRFWGEVPNLFNQEQAARELRWHPDRLDVEAQMEAAAGFNVSLDDLRMDEQDDTWGSQKIGPPRRPAPGWMEGSLRYLGVGRAQDTGKKILIVMTDAALRIRDGRSGSIAREDVLGTYLALEKQGHEPHLLVDDASTPGSYRVVHDDVIDDINRFDEMMLNREGPNFIGGTVHERHLWTARAICKFKGRMSYLFADPEMRKGEYLSAFLHDLYEGKGMKNYHGRAIDKKGLNDLIPQAMLEENISKTSKAQALVRSEYPCGPDHPIHAKRKFEEIQFVDSWREGLFNIRKIEPSDIPFEELLKSACYVGSDKRARHRRLMELDLLSTTAEDEGLVKYYGKMSRVINEMRGIDVQKLGGVEGTIALDDVNAVMSKHIASLVIGHTDQQNTGLNHRYIQGLLLKRSILADHDQDEHGLLCLDPKLRQAIFFKDAAAYRERLLYVRIEKNFNEIIRRLAIETERIKNESVEGLLKRVRGA
jgi:hypothetical protein